MSYLLLNDLSMWGDIKRLNNFNGEHVKDKTGITTAQLAKEVVLFRISKESADCPTVPRIKEVSPMAAAYVIRTIALKLCDSGVLGFYTKTMLKDIATCQEIYRIIVEMRLSGINATAFSLCTTQRIKDLKTIFDSFVLRLSMDNMYDNARFICDAVRYLSEEGFAEQYRSSLGNEDIEAYHPGDHALSAEEKKLEELLNVKVTESPFTYRKDGEQKRPAFSFYRAYGLENEIRKITETIEKEQIPFGDVQILYSSDKYEGYIKSVLGREGIAYTFQSGRTPDNEYYELFRLILEWACGGYYFKDFRKICSHSLMQKTCFGVRVSKDSEIAWGRERYVARADDMTKELVAKKQADENAYVGNQEKYYAMMHDLACIFDPAKGTPDSGITLIDLYERIYGFASNYVGKLFVPKQKEETEKKEEQKNIIMPDIEDIAAVIDRRRVGRAMLKDEKKDISVISGIMGKISTEEATELLLDHLNDLRCRESKKADSVAVSRIGGVKIPERSHCFVVGLSFGEFNKKTSDSAVMSDEEMEELLVSPLHPASKVNLYLEDDLRNTLELQTGKVYMSYTYFDTADILEGSPADIFIEYLDKYGVKDDGSALELKDIEKVGFVDIGTERLKFSYADFGERSARRKARRIEQPADVDEEETYDSEEIEQEKEPLLENDAEEEPAEKKKREQWFSATGIQKLLKCPLSFFYQTEEHVEEESEYEVSLGDWLSAAARGNYAHKILEEYLTQAKDDDDRLCDKLNEGLFDRIVNDTYEQYLSKYVITNVEIVQKVAAEYKAKLRNYLENIHEDCRKNGWRILVCEGRFEYRNSKLDQDVSKHELLKDRKTIPLVFNGIIDRIDYKIQENGERVYRISDYKSGHINTQKKEFESGWLIQHELYMRILEAFSKDDEFCFTHDGKRIKVPSGQIESFEYDYVFADVNEEHKYLFTEMSDDTYQLMVDGIAKYYANLAARTLPSGGTLMNNERCKYCSYTDICQEAKTISEMSFSNEEGEE